MAGKTKRNELTKAFVDVWRREECLWDVLHIITKIAKRSRKVSTIMEKFDMTG